MSTIPDRRTKAAINGIIELANKYRYLHEIRGGMSQAMKTLAAWSRRLFALIKYINKGSIEFEQLWIDTIVIWARLEEAYRILPNASPDAPAWTARKIVNEMRLDLLNWLVIFSEGQVTPQEIKYIIEEEKDVSDFVGGGPWSTWYEPKEPTNKKASRLDMRTGSLGQR